MTEFKNLSLPKYLFCLSSLFSKRTSVDLSKNFFLYVEFFSSSSACNLINLFLAIFESTSFNFEAGVPGLAL